jgi:predicted transcriptional regulator
MADQDLTTLTTEIVARFVGSNTVTAEALPDLIRSVYRSLVLIREGKAAGGAEPTLPKATQPQIRKSVTPDALISFIDGKGYRTLRRHLTAHGHTPESYREEFGLPKDYPLVAPNYSKARSEMAKATGLGAKGRKRRR